MMSGRKENNQFGERLRMAREIRRFNQAGLAAKAGFPASSIAMFEGGMRKPSLENFRRLVVALEISADYLLGRTDEPFPASQTGQLYRAFGKMPAEDRALLAARKGRPVTLARFWACCPALADPALPGRIAASARLHRQPPPLRLFSAHIPRQWQCASQPFQAVA